MLAVLWAQTHRDRPVRIFYELILRQDIAALPVFAAAGFGAAAVALLRPSAAALAQRVSSHPLGLAALAFSAYAIGAPFVYHGHPLSMDEYLPVFQSKIFLAGRLHGTAPPDLVDVIAFPPFQEYFFAVNHATGAVASRYWPALALLLVPLTATGLEWLFNPIVTACTLLALDSLLRKLQFDDVRRGLALLMTLAASAIAINAMSFYAMPLLLLCNVLFTRLVLECSAKALLAAGVIGSIGLTALNPVPHILYALPWIYWLTVRSGAGWRSLIWLATGYLPLVLLLGVGWPIAYHQFASDVPSATGSGLAAMVRIFSLPSLDILTARVFAIVKLDLWGIPGMFPLAVAGMFIWKADIGRTFTCCALLAIGGYLFVPLDQGHGWGYRYFHQAWLTLPILAVGALGSLAQDDPWRPRLSVFLALACIGSLVLLIPMRSVQVEEFMSAHLAQVPPHSEPRSREITFVDGQCGYYSADLVQNDPFLRGPELRFLSMGEEKNREIAARFLADPVVVARTQCGERWVDRQRLRY